MRPSKAVMVGLVVASVIAIGGTGFAAFTSTAYISATGTAGTVGPLTWGTGHSLVYGKGGIGSNYVTCSASVGPSNHLYLSANNLGPGDFCYYADSLNNAGSLPAVPSEAIGTSSGSACSSMYYGDNVFSPEIIVGSGGQTAGPNSAWTIPAYGLQDWVMIIQLSPYAGGSGGGSCGFLVTVTGTAA